MTLAVGQEAPDFELVGTPPQPLKLSSLRGQKNVVLVFYELAFNDDCTAELQAFEELRPEFEAADAQILAVSIDPPGIAQGFAQTYNLSFPLLSAALHYDVFRLYDAWQEKQGFASQEGGIAARVTYVIDKQGRIRGKVENVADVRDHAREALRIVKEIAG